MGNSDDDYDEYSISAASDPKMREAIGGVCVHWAILELTVERVIANLNGNPEIVTFEEDLGHRVDTLKKIARKMPTWILPETDRKKIIDLAIEIGDMKEDRHRIAHGLWAMDGNGNLLSFFPRAKRHSEYAPMTTDEIIEIKRAIFRLQKRLSAFASSTKAVALASRQKQPKPMRQLRTRKK